MNSIRTKVTVALLLMSVLVIAVLGFGSRWLIQAEFDELVETRAMGGFMNEIADYYRTYGSWEEAGKKESFLEFLDRTRAQPEPNAEALQGKPPAPAEMAGLQGRPPALNNADQPRRFFALSGEPPEIAVVDEHGLALLPLAGLRPGDEVDSALRTHPKPIMIGGRQVGMAIVMKFPPMTEVEQRYLAAMQRGWLYALFAAVVIAVPAGIWLGRQITRPILSLRMAMQEISEGQLGQHVPVSTNDEIGQLADDFNRMSTELFATHKELKELSLRDELTRLPNRRAFDELLQALVAQGRRQGQPLAVAIGDVDYFKSINDTFSHSVGDKVLQEVAMLLNANLRNADVVARYGGEEFAFLFTVTPLHNCKQLCEKLRTAVASHDWSTLAPGLSVTLSFGFAEHLPEDALYDSMRRADDKLYEAKARGRNRVCG